MRIYSMTATFGKLEHKTLTLEPGLNVISAPNEWGKSTWCAFLVAMLYGIDTRQRSTQGTLADKERYAPWSGSPMSGKIDLCWNGRDITIQRSTKGRNIMGEFSAFETATGLAVAELTAENCGQMLLGVEKSVFTRAGFIRFSDLPVSQDDALRRRLNALVTTGDESGESDALEQKLRDLKNRCRHNKTGRLPQLEAQQEEITEKLQKLQQLQAEAEHLHRQKESVSQQLQQLENHKVALDYAAASEDARRVAAARKEAARARERYESQNALCMTLPSREEAQENILQLEQLQMDQDTLQAEALPPAPEKPEPPAAFAGLTPGQALLQARHDKQDYDRLCKPTALYALIGSILCILGGILLLLFADWRFAVPMLVIAAGLLILYFRANAQRKAEYQKLTHRYGSLAAILWIPLAEGYGEAMAEYTRQAATYQTQTEALGSRKNALAENAEFFTGGEPISVCLARWREVLSRHEALETAYHTWEQADSHAQALEQMAKSAQSPAFADTLSHDSKTTERLLAEATLEQRQLHQRHGQILGQMEALGQPEILEQQLAANQEKIRELEDIYSATVLALETLQEASNSLQRKFAPRISRRAQTLFAQLTESRYDRLLLGADLSVSTGAEGEDILRPGLWRSDGTADQLYLALRLAVAEALTPQAPLVLDDALVRFDDLRLASAMEVLKEEATRKQVIVFTCQGREQEYL